MKFLPEQKNKKLWSVVLLAASLAGIVYFNFFAGPSAVKRRPPGETFPAADPAAGGATPAGGTPASGAKPVAKKSQGGLLPYGTKIEIMVIEQTKFKILKPAQPVSVKPEELGRDDLFAR